MPDKIDSENYFSVEKNFSSQIFLSPQSMLENEDILDKKCEGLLDNNVILFWFS